MSSLVCTARQVCSAELLPPAIRFCLRCNSLQCVLCEKEIHQSLDKQNHERLNLDNINDESCSIDKCHPAVFYCSTCTLLFCYLCYEKKHSNSEGREHKVQKYREEKVLQKDKDQ